MYAGSHMVEFLKIIEILQRGRSTHPLKVVDKRGAVGGRHHHRAAANGHRPFRVAGVMHILGRSLGD